MKNIGKYSSNKFLLSVLDVLHVRRKSTGVITEKNVILQNTLCDIYLTSGQRSERKRWISLSENSDLLIWMVNLSNYYKLCYEDNKTSRLEEDLIAFEEYVNLPVFENVPVFLILSMFDRYEESLYHHSFSKFCPDFDKNKEDPNEYIKKKFQKKTKKELIIFEQYGFDELRIEVLSKLIIQKLNGGFVKNYYSYHSKLKKFSEDFHDVLFVYSK